MASTISLILLLLGAMVAVIGLGRDWRLLATRRPKKDVARAKGSPEMGTLYAFSLGMMPWSKESTRHHLLAYLRGLGFHLGIPVALAVVVIGPQLASAAPQLRITLALLTAAAAALCAVGVVLRLAQTNLRRLSQPDDYAALAVVTLFLASASAAALAPELVALNRTICALMLGYLPFGKLRHSFYFFASRRLFGVFYGRRGVIHMARYR